MRQLGYFILLIAALLTTLQQTDSLALPKNKESESGSHENPEVSTALSNEDRSSNDGDDEPIQMVTHQPGVTVPILISITTTTESHFEEDSKEVPDHQLETDNKTVVQDEQSSTEVSDPVAVEPPIKPQGVRPPKIKNFHVERENLSVEVMDHPTVVTVKPQRMNQVARNGPIIRPLIPENSAFFVERVVEEVRDLVPAVTAAPASKRVIQTPRATATPKVQQQTHVRKAIPLNRFVSKNRDDISLEVDVTATSSTGKPVITRDQSTIRAGRVRTAISAITTTVPKTSEERIPSRFIDVKVMNTKPSIKEQVVRTTTASSKSIRRPISRQPTVSRDRVTPSAKHAITTQVARNQPTPTTKTSRPVVRPKPAASREEISKHSEEEETLSSERDRISFSAVRLNKPVAAITQAVLTTPATTTQPTLAVNPAATITIVVMTTPATAVKPVVTPARRVSPATTSRLVNHGKPVLPSKHSSERGNVSLETKDRIRTTPATKQIVRTQPRITRIFSALAAPSTVAKKLPNHSNEDISMATGLNRTETVDAVHTERIEDKISLEVGNRVVVETTKKATTQSIVPTSTTTEISKSEEEEVASEEDAVKQDEEDKTAGLDAVHSSESGGPGLSTQMRDQVAPNIKSSKPVTQTPESLEDVTKEQGDKNETETEAGIQSNEQEEEASLEASHNKTETALDASHSNENDEDDDVSVEVGDEAAETSPAPVDPPVIVPTEAVPLSLPSNEDESFSMEMMDRVLHRVVQNQTSTNTTHRSDEDQDFSDDVKDRSSSSSSSSTTQIFKPTVETQTEPIRVVQTQSAVVQQAPQLHVTTKIVPTQSVQQAPKINLASKTVPTQSTVVQQVQKIDVTTETVPTQSKAVQQVVAKAIVAPPTVASNASNKPNNPKNFDKQKDLVNFSSESTDGVARPFAFNQTTVVPVVSPPFAEDLSFEVIDGVLYQEVRNDPTINDTHIIWEQADDQNLSLEVKDAVVYNETIIPTSDVEPDYNQTTMAPHHSDELDDNLPRPVGDGDLVVNSAIQSPTMAEDKPERPGSVTIELADEEIRPLVPNRSSSHGTHHSDDEREDEFPLESVDGKRPASSTNDGIHQSPHPAQGDFSLELGKPLNAQNQTDTVGVSSDSVDDTATDRNSEKHDNVSLEAKDGQQNNATLQPDSDLSLKDKDIVLNPIIDNNHQTIEETTTVATTTSNKQQRLLKKLANGVLDQLFSSDVDEEIRKQVHEFSLQALDSLRMADSHSATASSFSERRAAGSSSRNSNYLPLLIACLLFVFS